MTHSYLHNYVPVAYRDYLNGRITYTDLVRKFYNNYYKETK